VGASQGLPDCFSDQQQLMPWGRELTQRAPPPPSPPPDDRGHRSGATARAPVQAAAPQRRIGVVVRWPDHHESPHAGGATGGRAALQQARFPGPLRAGEHNSAPAAQAASESARGIAVPRAASLTLASRLWREAGRCGWARVRRSKWEHMGRWEAVFPVGQDSRGVAAND